MVKVKVCGITSVRDACLAAESGANAIGLVFAPSPRSVTVEAAWEVAAAVPDGVSKVGVFVNSSPEEVLAVAGEVGLDFAQLHGEESPEAVAAVREGGFRVIKALRVRDAGSLEVIEDYGADYFLLDTYSAKARGGTGERFDWGVAKALRGCANIIVSGGLAPENVREAIRYFEPYGVDASSSLEDTPGTKNGERVRRFVSAAKGE